MLTTTLFSLFLFAVSTSNACNTHISKPPLLWLADIRAGTTKSDITLNQHSPDRRLIRFEDGAIPIPITSKESIELQKSGLRYFDVTEQDLESVFTNRIAAKADSVTIQACEFISKVRIGPFSF